MAETLLGGTGTGSAVKQEVTNDNNNNISGTTTHNDTTHDMAGSQATGAPPSSSSFWDSVPDEVKNNPSVVPFHGKSAADVLQAYVNTKSLVGADTVKKLSKHATNEDKVKFLKDVMGLPSELAKYEVKAPTDATLNAEAVEKFKEVAFKNGLLPWQFEAILGEYANYNNAEMTKIQETIAQNQKEQLDTLKKEFGQAYDQNMRIAQDTLKELAGDRYEAVVQEMTERGWGNSPELARLFVSVGKMFFTEGEIKGKAKGNFALSPEEAQAKISEIQGNLEHPYHIAGHPNHQKAIEEVQKLFQFVSASEEAS